MHRCLLLLLFLIGCSLHAQVTFRKEFQSSGNNFPRNGCAVPGGGYLVCSSGNSFTRLDAAGNIIWSETISSPVYVESVAVSSDSGFVFSGYTYNNGPPSMNEIAGGKLDANGNVLWISVIDSTNKWIKTIPVPTPDGGMIVGSTESIALFSVSTATCIARFSSTGQLLWHKIIRANATTNYLMDIEESGGKYIVSARNDTTAWLYSCDGSGNVLWSTCNNSLPSFIYSPVDLAPTDSGYATIIKDNRIFFFDHYGNALGARMYSPPSGTLILETIQATNDGGLIAGGHEIIGSDSIIVLMKTNAMGQILWANQYDTSLRYIRNISQNTGGYFVTREMSLTTKFMIMQTDQQGHLNCGDQYLFLTAALLPLTSVAQTTTDLNSTAQSYYQPAYTVTTKTFTVYTPCSTIGIDEAEKPLFNVSPNPSAAVFSVTGCSKSAVFEVYSVTGQLLLHQERDPFIDLSNQPVGCYFLRITDGEQTAVQQLVVVH